MDLLLNLFRILLLLIGIFTLAFAVRHGRGRLTFGLIAAVVAGSLCILWAAILVRL